MVGRTVCAIAVASLSGLPGRRPDRPETGRLRCSTRRRRRSAARPRLRSTTAVELSGMSVWHQREQSERPEGPWVLTFADFTDTRNFAADAVRRTGRVRGYNTSDWVNNKEWDPDATLLVVSGVGLPAGRRPPATGSHAVGPRDAPGQPGARAHRPLCARRSGRPYRSGHAVGRLCAPCRWVHRRHCAREALPERAEPAAQGGRDHESPAV